MHLHTHSHDHGRAPAGDGTVAGQRRLRFAFFLNLGFTVLELIGGLLTNSTAILADAVHDLGDSLALGLGWGLERVAGRRGDAVFSYGYGRVSLLSAVINALVLIVGSLLVLAEAVPRLLAPEAVHAPGMIAFAVVGVAANGLAAWKLHGGASMNERLVSWHLIEDVLGWAAVLVVGLVLLVWDVPLLDPLLSILITAWVLWNVFRRLRQTMTLFLQGTPAGLDVGDLERRITRVQGVESAHHTHVWSLDGQRHVLTTHVVVPEELTAGAATAVRRRVKDALKDHDIAHATIEVEAGPCVHDGECA